VAEAEAILRLVFIDCGEPPDTTPMEELTSYSLYRKESFRLQRAVLLAALIMFVLVPAFFVQPSFQTSYSPKGERGLPVYTIKVNSILPVKRVVAILGNYRLPVYEVNGHEYTIEPTQNGSVDLTVELFSGQTVSGQLDVKNADVVTPQLLNFTHKDGKYELYLADDGVGVDYEGIYASKESGEIIYPESYDRQEGTVTFGEEVSGARVCIPDYFKNVLKINL
jgi:hypothetical protein